MVWGTVTDFQLQNPTVIDSALVSQSPMDIPFLACVTPLARDSANFVELDRAFVQVGFLYPISTAEQSRDMAQIQAGLALSDFFFFCSFSVSVSLSLSLPLFLSLTGSHAGEVSFKLCTPASVSQMQGLQASTARQPHPGALISIALLAAQRLPCIFL